MSITDSTTTIIQSAKGFFGGTMLSRFTGLLRDISLAYAFGTKSTLAAFMVAFRLAHLLRRLFGEGPMQSAFIPFYEELRKNNPEEALLFFRDLTYSVSSLLIIIIFFGMGVLTLGNLLFPNYSEVLQLTLIMLPSLFFICLFGLHMALLQCHKSYFIPSFAPTAFNLVWIGATLLLVQTPLSLAMKWLSFAVVIACLTQWLMTLPKTYTIWKGYSTVKWWKEIKLFSNQVRNLVKPLTLGIIGVAAAQINSASDALFARFADSEGPAFLWYSIRVQQLPLSLFGIAFSGALLPPLARAIKRGEQGKFLTFFEFSVSQATALMIPITIGSIILAPEIINLLYGHGDFTFHAGKETTSCLIAYLLGLVPITLTLLLAPAHYSFGNYRTPAIASIISMSINTFLNGFGVFYLEWGVTSIAIATSFCSWINLYLLTKALSQMTPLPKLMLFLRKAMPVFIASLIAAVITIGFSHVFIANNPFIALCLGQECEMSRLFVNQFLALILPGIIFLAVLVFSAIVMNISELKELKGMVYGK